MLRILVILFLLSLFILFLCLCLPRCMMLKGGGNDEDSPIYDKLIELDLTKEEALKLSREIMKVLTDYSENTFVVSQKLDRIFMKLDKESLKEIQKNKEHIKVLLDIQETAHSLRVIERGEESEVCSMFECPKCKAKKHTYREIVTRSIDEPVSIKCQCKSCGFKWDQD